ALNLRKESQSAAGGTKIEQRRLQNASIGQETPVSIYKRGQIYWYKFTFNGEAIRESTRQTNQHIARQMEAAHRSSLAKGEVGIRDKKVVPTLKAFCVERVEPWAKSTFEKASAKTWLWYG